MIENDSAERLPSNAAHDYVQGNGGPDNALLPAGGVLVIVLPRRGHHGFHECRFAKRCTAPFPDFLPVLASILHAKQKLAQPFYFIFFGQSGMLPPSADRFAVPS